MLDLSMMELDILRTSVNVVPPQREIVRNILNINWAQCKYAAPSTSHLKRHYVNKHTVVRYSCVQCDYAATDASNLNIHVKKNIWREKHSCDSVSLSKKKYSEGKT